MVLRIGKKTLLTLLTFITGFLITLIQTFAWEDAGKTKQDKAYQYDFQLNYWNEQIHQKFNNLRASEAVPRLLNFEGERVVDSNFFRDISEYHFLIKELMRVLKLKSNVSLNLLDDLIYLNEKGAQHVPDFSKVATDVKELENLLKEHHKREKRLNTFLPELISSFEYEGNLSSEKKIELSVKQIDLIMELYTDEALFVSKNTDPFSFTRDLGNSSYKTLANYKTVLKGYNKQVSIEDSYKKSTLIFLALISLYFSALIVLKPDETTNYKISVNSETFDVDIKT